jgi:beta-glucuronidase
VRKPFQLPAILFCVLFLACVTVPRALAEPGPPTLIGNVPNRTTISLDGVWHYIVDPYETGLGMRFYENSRPKSKSDLVEYDFDKSGRLAVPGDWNSQHESLLFYEGPLWYQRYFSYARQPGSRVFLYFGAANDQARVWLNGAKLGEHIGGFSPFDFEITRQLSDGQNSLVVEVNNARHADSVPALSTDWWNYGGITRSVQLIEVPETFIQNYVVQLERGSEDEIAGWVQLNGSARARPATLEIPELNLKTTVNPDANGYAAFQVGAKPQLWSPDSPKLYRVLLSAGDDKLEDQIGFRTIETRGTQILLNGKPVFLRGVSMHEEAPFRGGRGLSEDEVRTLLQWAKDLGCNFVRLAHYTHNEHVVRLADQMGLLLWSEVPVYWDTAWENPATLDNAEAQIRDAIARDHNRASVILWSMSNETPVSAPRTEFIRRLAEFTRKNDSTRLLTSAMNRMQKDDPKNRVLNDPLGEFLDVLGVNEYIGWYEGRPEDADDTRWTSPWSKPAIVSEFGAGAPYNNHGDAGTRWTEEYQANLYEHQLKMLRQIPFLAGMSPWVLMDFRSPRRFLPDVQDYYNRKGLISDHGQRKQAFYVLQKFYREIGR